jgi:hypothetical protein
MERLRAAWRPSRNASSSSHTSPHWDRRSPPSPRYGRQLFTAMIVVAGLAMFTPARAAATTSGAWFRSGSWPTNEQCQPIKDEVWAGGNLTNLWFGEPCSHRPGRLLLQIYQEF